MLRRAMAFSLMMMVAGGFDLCGSPCERARADENPAEGPRKIGPLVLIGGHEDTDGKEDILREVVRLSGGEEARIAVITIASEKPEEMAEKYREAFGRLGVKGLRFVTSRSRDEADRDENLEAIRWATCAFFTGGDQQDLVKTVRNTKLDELLHRRNLEGQVIAGTSAGAAMMSELMAESGRGATSPRAGLVELGHGLDFLPGTIIDSHFSQRGRMGRLLSVVSLRPQAIAIGIDEDTALVVTGRERCEVIGKGAVNVIDTSRMTHNSREGADRGEPLALFGLTLHVLSQGCVFDLRTMMPSGPEDGKRSRSAR